MQGTNVLAMMHIAGALSGTVTRKFVVPFNASLVSVQVSAGANTNSELDLGTTSDGDAYIDGTALGASGAPVTVAASSFLTGGPVRLRAGDTLVASVTKGSSAASDVSIYLGFTEG